MKEKGGGNPAVKKHNNSNSGVPDWLLESIRMDELHEAFSNHHFIVQSELDAGKRKHGQPPDSQPRFKPLDWDTTSYDANETVVVRHFFTENTELGNRIKDILNSKGIEVTDVGFGTVGSMREEDTDRKRGRLSHSISVDWKDDGESRTTGFFFVITKTGLADFGMKERPGPTLEADAARFGLPRWGEPPEQLVATLKDIFHHILAPPVRKR